jgi:transcriptional regulator with XRE-family HTH domain
MAERIKALRAAKGEKYTQAKLAEDSGLSQAQIASIETGARGTRFDRLAKIAKVLGTTPDYLAFGEKKDPAPQFITRPNNFSDEDWQAVLFIYEYVRKQKETLGDLEIFQDTISHIGPEDLEDAAQIVPVFRSYFEARGKKTQQTKDVEEKQEIN